ncbi:2812_t:CDS:2, partial [Dentiscutata heterogama]
KQTNYERKGIFDQYKDYYELDINEVSSILLDHYENNCRSSWKGNFSAPVEEILKNDKTNVLDSGYVILQTRSYLLRASLT